MDKAVEILNRHSKRYGEVTDNPRAIVCATEALEAMKEFADYILKSKVDSITDEKTCKWKWYEECYETSCGNEFILLHDTPKDNGMKYCPFCGNKLEQLLKQ